MTEKFSDPTESLPWPDRVRRRYERADLTSSRTALHIRGDLLQLRGEVEERGDSYGHQQARELLLGYLRQVPEDFLTDGDRRLLGLQPSTSGNGPASNGGEPDGGEREESNRLRRLREAVEDLPEPYPSNRDRGESEKLSRHLYALRSRLDRLVAQEDQYGQEQKAVNRNRAERNALIFTLQQLAPLAGAAAAATPVPARSRKHDLEYVGLQIEEATRLIEEGYTKVDARRPGVLLHDRIEDAAPVEVSLPVWFYVMGTARA